MSGAHRERPDLMDCNCRCHGCVEPDVSFFCPICGGTDMNLVLVPHPPGPHSTQRISHDEAKAWVALREAEALP